MSPQQQQDDATRKLKRKVDEVGDGEDGKGRKNDQQSKDRPKKMKLQDADRLEAASTGDAKSRPASKLNEEELGGNAVGTEEGLADKGEEQPGLKKVTEAAMEERKGDVEFKVVRNDGRDESLVILTALKNIFQKQLPNMPKEYIARLVYDINHCGLAVIKANKILGGVSIRPFPHKRFAEIVFLAISSTEQVKGYGSRLMAHLKEFVKAEYGIKHFLTYADNYAVGYFKKQGFTTDISLPLSEWMAYIKDYEGGTLMQCTMVDKIDYLDVYGILAQQRRAILTKIVRTAHSNIIYEGIPKTVGVLEPKHVPGLLLAGWTPMMDKIAELRLKQPKSGLPKLLLEIVEDLKVSTHAWPFASPVTGVENYYDVIKEPMDLQTLGDNVSKDIYKSFDEFEKDARKIFNNCRIFNEEGSRYVKCADELEKEFNKLMAQKKDAWEKGDSTHSKAAETRTNIP